MSHTKYAHTMWLNPVTGITENLPENAVTYITLTKQYGDTIKRSWLEFQFKAVPPQTGTKKEYAKIATKFSACMSKTKDILLTEHKMYLKYDSNDGYKINFPADTTSLAVTDFAHHFSGSLNQLLKILSYINKKGLTKISKQEILDAQKLFGDLQNYSISKNIIP